MRGPEQGVLIFRVLAVELESPERRLGERSRNFGGETYFLGVKKGRAGKYKTFIFGRAYNAETYTQNLIALPVSFGGMQDLASREKELSL